MEARASEVWDYEELTSLEETDDSELGGATARTRGHGCVAHLFRFDGAR